MDDVRGRHTSEIRTGEFHMSRILINPRLKGALVE
jgi:hypothetical protein